MKLNIICVFNQIRKYSVGLSALALLAQPVWAGSYSVSIPPYSDYPLGWSFQNATVSSVFTSPDDGTELWFLNPSNGVWSSVNYDFGSWSNPNYVLTTGVGFFYRNPLGTTKSLTVSGTDVTAGSVTFNFTAGKTYFLGLAYLYTDETQNWIECVKNQNQVPVYTAKHLHYSAVNGDVFGIWSGGGWASGVRVGTNCSFTPGSPFWENTATSCAWAWGALLSPRVYNGHGFMFTPASNTSWTQYPNAGLGVCN